jgi:hypothetical protein
MKSELHVSINVTFPYRGCKWDTPECWDHYVKDIDEAIGMALNELENVDVPAQIHVHKVEQRVS